MRTSISLLMHLFQQISNNTHFNRGTKLFQAAINAATLRTSLLLNAFSPVRDTQSPTFKTKALRLVSNVQHI